MGRWVGNHRIGKDNTVRLVSLALLILVAFGLRTYHLDFQSFWRDEVDAVIFAQESVPSLLAKFTKVGENGPMFFAILHYWVAAAGDSEFSLRFFSVIFGVVTVALTYTAGARIVGRGTGLMAAAIAAIAPYYVWYSQEAKMYTLLAALTLLSVYLFVKALETNRPVSWLLFVIATSISLYVHFFAALVLVGEAAIFLAGAKRYRDRVTGFAVSGAALTLPYLPLAVWQLPMLVSPPTSPYEFMPLDTVGTILLFAFSEGFAGGRNFLAVTTFTFLLLSAAVFGRKESEDLASPSATGPGPDSEDAKDTKHEPLTAKLTSSQGGSRWPITVLLLYLLVPLLTFYVVSLRYPMFTERYLIIVLPAFEMLAGAGLYAVLRRTIVLFTVCATLVLIFSLGAVFAFQQATIKADFRSAVRYYEANARVDDTIMTIMPYMRRSFDYYHRGPYRWVEPPYTNQGLTEAEVGRDLQQATGGVRRIWVFLAEEPFWDRQALARAWLEKNGRLLAVEEFVGVGLRYYELR